MKRALDLAIVVGGAPLFVPIMLLCVIVVRLSIGTPTLFIQRRAGKGGIPFAMVKFRSMTDSRDADGNPLPDEQRLTRWSRMLRSFSLDELPELWNVLRGDMSLVGPRPLLLEYLPLYTHEQQRRHNVLPGITGWAQIHGRNALTWEEKFALDVWYVDHRSLWLDVKILWLTFWRVLRREGVSHASHATMPVFRGSALRD